VFLHRVSEWIGEYVPNNVEQYPAILLSLGALSECPPTPAATRALMTALTFSHLTSVLAGHTDAVRNLAWSPDGRWIVIASRDGTAGIWDCSVDALVRFLTVHSDMVEMVAWSPDSARVNDLFPRRDRTRVGRGVLGITMFLIASDGQVQEV
jgi:WD40 repeat protein